MKILIKYTNGKFLWKEMEDKPPEYITETEIGCEPVCCGNVSPTGECYGACAEASPIQIPVEMPNEAYYSWNENFHSKEGWGECMLPRLWNAVFNAFSDKYDVNKSWMLPTDAYITIDKDLCRIENGKLYLVLKSHYLTKWKE